VKQYILFLRFDVGIQFLLIITALFSAFTVIGLAITLPTLIVWQVISALIGYFVLRDRMHGKFLVAVVLLFSIIWLISLTNMVSIFVMLPLVIVIPSFLAIEYYDLNKKLLESLKKEYQTEEHDFNEDLLDEQLIIT